jgi:AcrR family transcriptional regulator
VGLEVETKQRLLAAAVKVLEEGGEQALRVQEIADAAGVTKPSVHHFFGSREGLIERAQGERYQQGVAEIVDVMVPELQKCKTGDEFFSVLNEHIDLAYSDARKNVRRHRVAVLGSAMSRPTLEESLADAQDATDQALANALRIGQKKGWIPSELDLVVFSDWFLAQIIGRILVDIASNESAVEQWNRISKLAILTLLGCPPHLIETFQVGK